MPKVSVLRRSLLVEGRPALIQAGALHYARLPAPSLWEPVLERIRAAGLNAVFIPFPWAYHSPAPGFHDFTGPRDLRPLLTASERQGLWLIPHVGPWLGLGLDGGGIPAWLHRTPEARPLPSPVSSEPARLAQAGATPNSAFLRHVGAWWETVLPQLLAQPNLLAMVLHPGITADGNVLDGYASPLLDLARRLGIHVPVALPSACLAELHEDVAADVLPWTDLGPAVGRAGSAVEADALGGLAVIDVSLPASWTGARPPDPSRAGSADHPRPLVAWAAGMGLAILVLDPMHHGVNWGRWATPGRDTLYGYGAPLGELAGPTPRYRNAQRLALALETLGPLRVEEPMSSGHRTTGSSTRYPGAKTDRVWMGVTDAAGSALPARQPVWADPPEALAWSRWHPDGAVAALIERTGSETLVRLALSDGDADDIVAEDIPLPAGEVRILPIDWSLVDGRLLSTTLEPVLHTVVAGRELLVLRNDVGGELLLPADFRHRHSRGPVYVDRTVLGSRKAAVAVHIDPARIASVVLDGPEGHALQILALEPDRAARVWPLDDAWRTMPVPPAQWTPDEDAPARGLVIGPDLVVPEDEGAFRLLATTKGFGYRWGPWRGSDPHTWLSPFTWSGPPDVRLPALAWTRRPGAAEALPSYDDRTWRFVAPVGLLTTEALGVDYGFVWYRAHFDGHAEAVTVACRHACDLFLNGQHIAALNPPPDYGAVAPKTLPLPARYLQAHNVLAMLVEHLGRAETWDAAASPHGLTTFDLDDAPVREWRVRAGLSGEVQRQGFYGFADWSLIEGGGVGDLATGEDAVTWHRATFDLALPRDVDVPIFFILDQTPTKSYIYLNGYLIGRLRYPHSPERRFWLPDGLLRRTGTNELLVAQWTRGATPGLGVARLDAGPPAIWHRQSAV